MAIIKSSDLDFDNIKSNLKTYLQQSEEFSDYEFEASGISNILDVLAYNTHINGLVANFAINESFITTSQLRPSVVSHAESLGYFPRSKTSAFGVINASVNAASTTLDQRIVLPVNTQFTASVDDVTYTFQTLEEHVAIVDDNGVYTFKNSDGTNDLIITEGEIKTKTFLVGEAEEEQVYVIPDENMDTATLVIKVYDNATATTHTTFTNVKDVARVDADSRVYLIREVPNGYYEVTFSDGNVLGLAPVAGNKIVMEYISSSGPDANGATAFSAIDTVEISGNDFDLSVTTVSNSTGGSEKESISSIKLNAPLSFASQQRLVTADDYRAAILAKYSNTVDDVIAFGGNDQVPPQYGKVFVSIKFKDNIGAVVQQSVKDSIINDLSANLAIMSIDTVFEDPETTFLELGTTFNFNPDLTGETDRAIEAQVTSTINQYFTDNLKRFDKIFRRSNLLTQIDEISPAILNSKMTVKMQQRFTPIIGVSGVYRLYFPAAIADPDDENYIVTTTNFTFSGQVAQIRNALNSQQLQIVSPTGEVLRDAIGEYTPSTGKFELIGFLPTSFIGESIKVSATPANQSTIKPLRSYVIDIDNSRSFSQAVADYEETRVTL